MLCFVIKMKEGLNIRDKPSHAMAQIYNEV